MGRALRRSLARGGLVGRLEVLRVRGAAALARVGVAALGFGRAAEPPPWHVVEQLLAHAPVGDRAALAAAAGILCLVVIDGAHAIDLVLGHVVVSVVGLRG
jgi:hypothetical protein